MTRDVPGPIENRLIVGAREWAQSAGNRDDRNQVLNRIVDETAQRAKSGSHILELGSGPGFLAERVLRRSSDVHYTAIEVSRAMQAMARRRLEPFYSGVEFVERDFGSRTWTSGLKPVDIAVSNRSVHRLPHKKYAAELHRQVHGLLKPGGAFLMSDHVGGDGGLPNGELYMTGDEQKDALLAGGFSRVEELMRRGTLTLHLARKGSV